MTRNIEPPTPELTEEEKEAIWAEAQAEVAEELRAKAAEALKAEYAKRIRQSLIPDEKLEPILIDLAGHADRIRLDSVEYFHGSTYYMPLAMRQTVNEIMANTWKHEREIGGANSNMYRQPLERTLRPSDLGKPLTNLLRM